MVHGDCVGRTPAEAALPGKAGAPACVGLKVKTGARGDPDSRIACSYPPSSGWSYINPMLPRSTVVGLSAQATPARGPKLLRSILKLCDEASGAFATPSGY